MIFPGPDNVETNINLGVALAQELSHPGVFCETVARHYPWGSEIDLSYPGRWYRLWQRRRITMLATHGGQVIMIKRNGTRVVL